ncbi:MAG TPA: YfdX family protein, partial [Steroidobacteraceae bacterium]|nr:YfdX family protein [Steroidobacteraceae bacterium]
MILKSQIFAIAALTAASGMLLGATAMAAAPSDASSAPTGASSNANDKVADGIFDKGRTAFRDIQDARFDIFDGHPRQALKLMQTSKTLLGEAQGEIAAHPAADMEKGGIPVDSQLTVADDYVMTPEKQRHLDQANEHLKNGERSKAVEQLRLADIDVNSTVLSLPA